MPGRPDLISQEYITPVSVTTSPFGGGGGGGGYRSNNNATIRSELVYSDLRPKPLSCRRKRFIVTNVVFVVVQFCVLLVLVLSMTLRHPLKRGRSTGSNGCELCDLWCTSNCSHLAVDGDEGLTLKVINVNDTREGKDRTAGLCCVKRRDTLSINYEYLQKEKSTSGGSTGSLRERSFDGIRLKDKWVEESSTIWPRCNPSTSALTFHKKERSFVVTTDGTFFVHSRIDFNCLNTKNNFTRQQLKIESRTSDDSVFVDERAQLHGQSISMNNGSVVYTSTINVIVKLKRGDGLKFITDPSNCTLPRTLVVFQSKDVL